MACITDEQVAALLDGRLAAAERAAVEAELARCAGCQALVCAVLTASLADLGASRPTLPTATPTPTRLGRYRVDGLLGAGGMGLVFAGYDADLDRRVALKVLRQGDDEAARAHLRSEARALAALRHPHVVSAYGYEEAPPLAVLVMEFVDGESLAARLRRGPLPVAAAVALVADVAAGLAAVHGAGLVHRDVKPANVLIGTAGVVRLADLGLARRPLADGSGGGTLPYMAPEVLAGDAADARSDQFSLGVVLWEALHGARPFAGTDAASLRAAMAAPLPPPRADLPPSLVRVLRRALASAPAARFADVAALEAALRAIVAAPARRRRRAWLGAMLGGSALGAAALAVVATRGAPPRPASPAVRATYACLREELARRAAGLAARPPQTCVGTAPPPGLGASAAAAQVRRAIGALAGGDAPAALATLGDDALAPAFVAEPAVQAAATWHRGRALVMVGRWQEGGAAMAAAGDAAVARGDTALAIEAYAEAAITHAALLDDVALGRVLLGRAAALVAGTDAPGRQADVASARGMLADAAGDPAAALAQLDVAVTARRADGDPAALAAQLMRRSRVRRATDRAGAVADATEAVALVTATFGADHPQTILDRDSLEVARRAADSDAAAIEVHQATVAALTAALGAADVRLADPLASLAAAVGSRGDYATAQRHYEQALALLERWYPRGMATADVLTSLGSLAYYRGDLVAAEARYRAALAVTRSALGAAHPRTALPLSVLATILGAQGRGADARALAQQAVTLRAAQPGGDRALAEAQQALALIDLQLGDLPAARAGFEAALATLQVVLPADHAELTYALAGLGETCLAQHDVRCAAPALERAVAIRTTKPMGAGLLAEAELTLASARWQQGRRADARALAQQARAHAPAERADLRAAIAAWLAAPG